jgi:hypothetical protein
MIFLLVGGYTQQAVHIRATISELIPAMLGELEPLLD